MAIVIIAEHKDGKKGHVRKGEVSFAGFPTLYLCPKKAEQARLDAHRGLGELGMHWDMEIVPVAMVQ